MTHGYWSMRQPLLNASTQDVAPRQIRDCQRVKEMPWLSGGVSSRGDVSASKAPPPGYSIRASGQQREQ